MTVFHSSSLVYGERVFRMQQRMVRTIFHQELMVNKMVV